MLSDIEISRQSPRLPIADLVYYDQWGQADSERLDSLTATLAAMQDDIQQRGIFPA